MIDFSFSSSIDHITNLLKDSMTITPKVTFNDSYEFTNEKFKIDHHKALSIKKSLKATHLKYNTDRFNAIKNILKAIYENEYEKSFSIHHQFPDPLFNLIGDYDHDKTVEFTFNKVMNEFKVSRKKIKNLDFYSDNFAERLALTLPKFIMLSKLKKHSSKCSLIRLVFKWIIHKRQMTADNDDHFRKILKSIEHFCPILFQLSIKYLIPSDSDFVSDSKSSLTFRDFIYYETCDYHFDLFSLFASAVEYSYINDGQFPSCEEFEIKFFNGNYNRNVVLKYLIIFHDPRNWMRTCIIKKDSSLKGIFDTISSKVTINSKYIDKLKSKGFDFKIMNMDYVNLFTFEFTIQTEKVIILSKTFSSLVFMLRELKKVELLKRSILERLLVFNSGNETLDLNQKIFEKLLMNRRYVNIGNYHEINEYLKLFDSSPLRLARLTLLDALTF